MPAWSQPLFGEGSASKRCFEKSLCRDNSGATFYKDFLKAKLERRGGILAERRKRGLKQPRVSSELRRLSPKDAHLYERVTSVEQPNFCGAKVPLPTALNLQKWREVLADHQDEDLFDMLCYGFPLGYSKSTPPRPSTSNHPSGERHSLSIQGYVDKERACGAIIGPFQLQPFEEWFNTSPIMTRPKKLSDERRVIFDLSFGDDLSVNGGIDKNWYEGALRRVWLPTADDIADLMIRLGRGALLFSLDIARAYRIFQIDPRDWPLTGFTVDGLFFLDKAVQFGARTGALICSLCTSGITKYHYTTTGHETYVYLDDFCGGGQSDRAWENYFQLIHLLFELGVELSYAKCLYPRTTLVWIGVEFDTNLMQLRIDPCKVDEVKTRVNTWVYSAERRNAKEMDSILGQLFHVVKCARKARPFLNRLQQFGREVHDKGPLVVTPDARSDLIWLSHFLHRFNGVRLLSPSKPHVCIAVDACLSGLGGICRSSAYKLRLPEWFITLNFNINELECLNALFALRHFAKAIRGAVICLLTDNAASVSNLTACKGRNRIMQSVSREIMMMCASHDADLVVKHIPGAELAATADALSRWHTGLEFRLKVARLVSDNILVQDLPEPMWMPPLGL